MLTWLRGCVLGWLLLASSAACGGRAVSGEADLPEAPLAGGAGQGSVLAGGSGGADPMADDGGSAGVGDAPDGAPSGDAGQLIASGPQKLVDVFVSEVGVYVVLGTSVTLFDRKDKVVQRVGAPLPLLAAAFDGERLAVADRNKLTIYDANLNLVSSTDTIETCGSLVVLSHHRAVCGPPHDAQRVFYTYDTSRGALLSHSLPYTYNGLPMRRVPGTDDFVTVPTELSGPDFHLYRLLDTDEVSFVNESPYDGGFHVSDTYGFNSSPATHLITDQGQLLEIYGDGCDALHNSVTSGCFLKDGSLGTLTESQRFAGLDTDDYAQTYAMVDTHPNVDPSDDAPIRNFLIQRVDFPSRMVIEQGKLSLQLGKLIAFRRDGPGRRVLIALRKGPLYYVEGERYPGYEIRSLAF